MLVYGKWPQSCQSSNKYLFTHGFIRSKWPGIQFPIYVTACAPCMVIEWPLGFCSGQMWHLTFMGTGYSTKLSLMLASFTNKLKVISKAVYGMFHSWCAPTGRSWKRTLGSQVLPEFLLAQTQYPTESLCVFKKRLAGVSFIHKLSVRNCTDFCIVSLSRDQVWKFPFSAVIFTWHTVITLKYQTPIFNFIVHTASSVSAGQNTNKPFDNKLDCFSSFYSFP